MIYPAPTKEQWEKLHPNVLSNNFMTSRNANRTENAPGEKHDGNPRFCKAMMRLTRKIISEPKRIITCLPHQCYFRT